MKGGAIRGGDALQGQEEARRSMSTRRRKERDGGEEALGRERRRAVRKKASRLPESGLGDASVGILIHVVSVIPRKGAAQTIQL